jgi:hypothetical protein
LVFHIQMDKMKKTFTLLVFFMVSFQARSQSVSIESIKINNTIPYSIHLSNLLKSNVTIDSITKVSKIMDASEADSLVYIGETYFEYYSNSKICQLNVVIFDNKVVSISVGKNILSAKTTFQDLTMMFPIDCKHTKAISIYGEKNPYEICSVGVTDGKGNLWDMRIIFFLHNDKLTRVDIWEPV